MDGHRVFLYVPVDEHAAASVAGVPFGEDVLIDRANVDRVRRHDRRPFTPQLSVACGESGVGDLDCQRLGDGEVEVAAADVSQVVFAMTVFTSSNFGDTGGQEARGFDGDEEEAFPGGDRSQVAAG